MYLINVPYLQRCYLACPHLSSGSSRAHHQAERNQIHICCLGKSSHLCSVLIHWDLRTGALWETYSQILEHLYFSANPKLIKTCRWDNVSTTKPISTSFACNMSLVFNQTFDHWFGAKTSMRSFFYIFSFAHLAKVDFPDPGTPLNNMSTKAELL